MRGRRIVAGVKRLIGQDPAHLGIGDANRARVVLHGPLLLDIARVRRELHNIRAATVVSGLNLALRHCVRTTQLSVCAVNVLSEGGF